MSDNDRESRRLTHREFVSEQLSLRAEYWALSGEYCKAHIARRKAHTNYRDEQILLRVDRYMTHKRTMAEKEAERREQCRIEGEVRREEINRLLSEYREEREAMAREWRELTEIMRERITQRAAENW
ncbi:hypothetical protein H8E77_15905 [bacterium]|nr:hypothetical protein [bacterium]